MKKYLVFMIIMIFASASAFSQESKQPWYAVATRDINQNPLYISPPPTYGFSVPVSYYFPARAPRPIVFNENAEDFDVPPGATWSVMGFIVAIDLDPGINGIQYIDVRFYEDLLNVDIFSQPTLVPFHIERIFNTQYFPSPIKGWMAFCTLNQPLILDGGKRYWISIGLETSPSWQGSAVWFNAGIDAYKAPGSPAPFCARTTPFETVWSYGPNYYGQNPPDLTLVILGDLVPEPVPLAGWLIPFVCLLIAVSLIIRYRRL